MNAGPRKGQSLRIPLRSPLSEACTARRGRLTRQNPLDARRQLTVAVPATQPYIVVITRFFSHA